MTLVQPLIIKRFTKRVAFCHPIQIIRDSWHLTYWIRVSVMNVVRQNFEYNAVQSYFHFLSSTYSHIPKIWWSIIFLEDFPLRTLFQSRLTFNKWVNQVTQTSDRWKSQTGNERRVNADLETWIEGFWYFQKNGLKLRVLVMCTKIRTFWC